MTTEFNANPAAVILSGDESFASHGSTQGSFMKLFRVVSAGAVVALSALAGVAPARAATITDNYTFTRLADTYGGHDIFLDASINNAGQIVYRTNLDAGGSGVYRYSGGVTSTVLQSGASQPFSSVGPVTINGSGAIAFTGTLASNGSRGVFRQSAGGAAITPLYTAPANYSSFDRSHITDAGAGAVVFQANTNAPVTYGVFRGDGSAAATPVTGAGNVQVSANDIAASSGGTAVFLGTEQVNGVLTLGVYTGDGSAPPARVLDSTGPYEIFSNPAMSTNGTVLVSAGPDGGLSNPDAPAHLVRIAPGGAAEVIATTESLFDGFGIYAVNAAGNFATYSALDTPSTYGVFAGPDPLRDKVLMTGDELFGETITLARISKQGLNDHGQIVIRAQTPSGEEMLVLATPVPEPASAAALLTPAAAVMLRRRRRRR